jgi:serine/threonine-protein kinase
MGTAHYSAPEQVRGEPATPATDIYSVGVVLYEMLTGRRPFTGDTPVAVALARLSEDPAEPRLIRAAVPDELNAVVMRALARQPEDRFASAAEMRAALEHASEAAVGQTQTLDVDDTIAVPRAPAALPLDSGREVGSAIPPGWAGKRVAMLLGPLIIIALLAWGLVAAIGGPTTTKVPNFVGMTIDQARAAARAEHLSVTPKFVASDVTRGTVLKQSVPTGNVVKPGATVTLTVSSGCCIVPDVRGMTLDEARRALENAHLQLGTENFTFTGFGKDGTIVSQDPPPKTQLSSGASVDVIFFKSGGEHHDHGKGND